MRRMTSRLATIGVFLAAVACDDRAQYATKERAVSSISAAPAREARSGYAGADGASKDAAQAVALGAAPPSTPMPTSVPTQEAVPGSMLIRQGNASVQVDSLEVGIARVRDVARRVGAIVANTSMQSGKNELRAASIELRIPSERFDEAVSGLTPLGKVESVNVSVADVGEEYVDIAARVANAKRLEQRLIDLLAHRTGRLSDVLGVEHELARVREEIERYEGRMRYLRTRASISTLTVAVHEPPPLVASHPGESPIRDAFKNSWRNFVTFVAGAIAIAGILVPLGLFVIGSALLWRRFGPSFKSAGAGSA